MNRRYFLKISALGAAVFLNPISLKAQLKPAKKPNIIFIFADQWRAQACGYAGDPNLAGKTPHLDKLAGESVNLSNAVSTCPVCTPYRASLLTGQYPLSHGLFLNDAPLAQNALSIAEVYKAEGYDTAYVGKWHIDGHGRGSYIPKERRQGFEYWKVLECTHDYNNSWYYADEDQTKRRWQGYDAIAQTHDIQEYLKANANNEKPFIMFLSWGPPHAPYNTAPEKYKNLFDPKDIKLSPNVPEPMKATAKKELAGYYAHIATLDECIGDINKTIAQSGIKDNTILVFTSDHGDMLGSHAQRKKQNPYEESIKVPFLVRYPAKLGQVSRVIDMPIGTPDIMPTLLGLCDIAIPASVEGTDYSKVLSGKTTAPDNAALIECLSPFGQWNRASGGKEYRGIRTKRYTYVRDLTGPWLLFDNEKDPYQLKNLVNSPESAAIQTNLEKQLAQKLQERNDKFKDGAEYIKKWDYKVINGTIPYRN
ncbi:MAG: sulfatase [Phycisphaerae bacterium]|nr:sulfatase [Phycisphaerae bacterium]